MIIGFIGTGVITSSVVTGLLTAKTDIQEIVLSPRNEKIASQLASRFEAVSVANDNQAVIDGSDLICIALRPQVARQALRGLNFRKNIPVISFVSTYSSSELAALLHPATSIFRMVPVPPVSKHLGPIAMFPQNTDIENVFSQIGTIVHAKSEEELHSLWAVTAMMAPYFGILKCMSDWLKDKGVDQAEADIYSSSLFHAVSVSGLEIKGQGFEQIIADHSTSQGLNEQLYREIENSGCFDTIQSGLSLISERLRGTADFEDTINQKTE